MVCLLARKSISQVRSRTSAKVGGWMSGKTVIEDLVDVVKH